jgi:hypothetical protein
LACSTCSVEQGPHTLGAPTVQTSHTKTNVWASATVGVTPQSFSGLPWMGRQGPHKYLKQGLKTSESGPGSTAACQIYYYLSACIVSCQFIAVFFCCSTTFIHANCDSKTS